MAVPYEALETLSKTQQRARWQELILATQNGSCVFLDDPKAMCTYDIGRNVYEHIRNNRLVVYAVNKQAGLQFDHDVITYSYGSIRPYRDYLSNLLSSNIFQFYPITALWFDNDRTPDPDPLHVKKSEPEKEQENITMIDIFSHLMKYDLFSIDVMIMVNYSGRLDGGKVNIMFHKHLSALAAAYNYTIEFLLTTQYRGKAFESGRASSAGPMWYEEIMLHKQ